MIARTVLKGGGGFLVKIFQGSMSKEFFDEVKREFEFAKISKPRASRQQSSEVYIAGKGLLKTPVKPGDLLELKVVERDNTGNGVSFIDGYRIVVRDGIPGETVKVRIKKAAASQALAVKI